MEQGPGGRRPAPAGREVTLRNGERVDLFAGIGLFEGLQALADREPGLFDALASRARGAAPAGGPAEVEALTAGGLLRPDGTVPPDVRAVLLSAWRDTPEGPVVSSPFLIRDEAERWLMEWARERVVAAILDHSRGHDGGRGR